MNIAEKKIGGNRKPPNFMLNFTEIRLLMLCMYRVQRGVKGRVICNGKVQVTG